MKKITIDVVGQMKCPNCGESKISTQTITIERKPKKNLIGGLLLFLAGLILAWMTIQAFLNPVIMEHSNPAPMGMVSAALMTYGCTLLTRYFGAAKPKRFKCRCQSCGHQWEDEESGVLITLLESLNNENKDIRQQAVWALGNTGDARAVEPLIQILNDESSKDVRSEIVQALTKTAGIRAVEFILHAAHDENSTVRAIARGELRKIKDKRAVEPLIEALKDEDYEVRVAAAGALGDIGDARAQDALTRAQEDDTRYVRYTSVVKKALNKIKAKKS
ncbi:MAG: HEAT repeat domain-containing protein [Candidatus Atribacteria bacterium]|nr:HEAT repeat domain-containing protein [Candidatus Atribacteria bacterium]